MNKDAKLFLKWWLYAYIGFICFRLFEGETLDGQVLVGGLFMQFLVASMWAVGYLIARTLVRKYLAQSKSDES